MEDAYELLGLSSSASDGAIKAALEHHREMYSSVTNSPDRELASRAELMLKKLDEVERKLVVTKPPSPPSPPDSDSTTGKESPTSEIAGSLYQNLSECVRLYRQNQVTEAHELLNRMHAAYPDRSMRTMLALKLLNDARSYVTYVDNWAYIHDPRSAAYVENRLENVRTLNVQDQHVTDSVANLYRLVQRAKSKQHEMAPRNPQNRPPAHFGEAAQQPGPKSNLLKSTASALGCIGIIAVLMAAIIGSEFLFRALFDNDGEATASDKARAVQNCKTAVNENLRAPSTAKFSDENVEYNPSDENDYQIVLTVDAQNGFGATVQSEFACQMLWNPSSESWKLQRVFER